MQERYDLGTRLIYFWNKNEKKISLSFIFVFEFLRFWHTCPTFLLSKFASQIKLMNSVVGQLLDSGSQGPRIPSPTVPGPGSQCLGSQVPGSQVLILDYTHIFGFSGKGNMIFPDNIRKTIFRCNFLETLSFQNICRKFKISIYFFGKDDLSFSV